MQDRLYAVGDIHGCSIALAKLLQVIDPHPEDTIVVLGDVIDYGPDTKGVTQQLIAISQRCTLILIRGNHEELLLDAVSSRSDVRHWIDWGIEIALRCSELIQED